MESVKNFLESSSINGLNHISTTRGSIRLLWTFVVFTCFSGAGILIYQSFQAWEESPISTTIETLSIEHTTSFPKVTVCPPKNTYTDLNYDLIMTQNMSLTNKIRNELTSFATELLYAHLHDEVLRNLSKFQEENKYYNWYYGFSKLAIPKPGYMGYDLDYEVTTTATSGSLTTQDFQQKFDSELVETNVYYGILIFPPASVSSKENVTLHFELKKVSMQESSNEKFYVDSIILKTDMTNFTTSFTPPLPPSNPFLLGGTLKRRKVYLQRKVSKEDVQKMEMTLMPGFKFKWFYTGDGIEEDAAYHDTAYYNKLFVRISLLTIIRVELTIIVDFYILYYKIVNDPVL